MNTEIGKDIAHAAALLRQGELVAIPTETVYGLAGNALDEDAVLKIYEAKNRPHFNPLIIHIASRDLISLYAKDIPVACHKLAEAFSPGPITFLLNKDEIIPDLVTAGSDKVALRIPSHPLCLSLLSQLDFPLAAPSANPSGYVSPVTPQHVYEGLNGKIPYILDGGPCGLGLESTIVGFEAGGQIILHRLGGVTKEEIQNVTGQPPILSLSLQLPQSPGQLKSHYATNTPLYIGKIPSLLKKFKEHRVAILTLNGIFENAKQDCQFQLSASGDLHEAARNLFRMLRQIDQLEMDAILVELVPEQGLGAAINDRLRRAQQIHKQPL